MKLKVGMHGEPSQPMIYSIRHFLSFWSFSNMNLSIDYKTDAISWIYDNTFFLSSFIDKSVIAYSFLVFCNIRCQALHNRYFVLKANLAASDLLFINLEYCFCRMTRCFCLFLEFQIRRSTNYFGQHCNFLSLVHRLLINVFAHPAWKVMWAFLIAWRHSSVVCRPSLIFL